MMTADDTRQQIDYMHLNLPVASDDASMMNSIGNM